jgi:hypothetical protein
MTAEIIGLLRFSAGSLRIICRMLTTQGQATRSIQLFAAQGVARGSLVRTETFPIRQNLVEEWP